MTRKVGPKGQVVLPKKMRDAMGLKPGDEVDFEFDGVAVRVVPSGPPADWRRFRGSMRGSDVWADMAADRALEREHEERLEKLASGRRRGTRR